MSASKRISGNYRIILIAGIGLGLTALLYLINQEILAGVAIILFGTLLLGTMISADAAKHARPLMLANLSANHREIILENAGTKFAEKIVVTAAGIENPWHVDILQPDETTKLALPTMVTSLIVEVTYQAQDGARKSKAFSLGKQEQEQDIFKPVFPIFGWKGKE